MNVVFIHNNGIMPERGGISRTTYNLGKSFLSRGCNVFFLGLLNTDKEYSYSSYQLFFPNYDQLESEANIKFIKNLIIENSIDAVINQNPLNPLLVDFIYECLSQFKDVKIISCYHNSILTPIYNYAYQKEYLLRKFHMSLLFYLLSRKIINILLVKSYIMKYRNDYKNALEKSDKVVLLCDGLVDEFKFITNVKNSDKIAVVPNMTPKIQFSGNINKKNVIIWVGTFNGPVKRPDLAIRVWGKLCRKYIDWEFKMLGDGPDLENMRKLANQMNLKRISFEGRVHPDNYYLSSKLIMVTSTHESFSLVTVESMKYGCIPFVFNSFPAASMIINQGINGFLIEPFDIEKMFDTIDRVINDPQLLDTLAKNAIKTSEEFSEPKVYNKWRHLVMGIS